MQFVDALELGKPRRTKDGYLAVRARASRIGVYQYGGREIDPENAHGLRDQASVNVLRDESTVFDKIAARSFLGKPITVDHPTEPVTAANWKDHARGTIMGALKDGEYLAFDLLLMDQVAIADVESGKQELSNGYAATLEFGDFTAPDGTKCPVRQARITDGNHIAIVDAGRAGSACRIGDASDGGNHLFQTCDAATVILNMADAPKETKVAETLTLDGLKVDLSDADAVKAAIQKLTDKASTAEQALKDATAEHDKAMGAKDAELDDLKAKVVDEATIDARAEEKAAVNAAAAKIADGLDTKGKSVADIRRMAVAKKLGDTVVADKSDDYVAARFDALVDAAGSDKSTVITAPIITGDGASELEKARAARRAALADAWKQAPANVA